MMPWIFVTLIFASPAPQAAEKHGLAVLDLEAVTGFDPQMAKLLNEVILSRLKQSDRFSSIIGSSDIATMLNMEQQKQALGCDEESCLAQLGGALGVPYVLQTNVGSMGGRLVLNLKILDVDEARVANRISKIYTDEGALLDGVGGAVDEVLKGGFPEPASIPKKQPTPITSDSQAKPQAVTSSKAQAPIPWLALGLAATGAATTLWGVTYAEASRQQLRENETITHFQTHQNDVQVANVLVTVGGGLLTAGLGSWVFSR